MAKDIQWRYSRKPWRVEKDYDRTFIMKGEAGDCDDGLCLIAEVFSENGNKEVMDLDGDSRLIAMAPDMAKALNDILIDLSRDRWDLAKQTARGALLTALGKVPCEQTG